MNKLPNPFLFEDGKQKANFWGMLWKDEEICVGNQSCVLARPNIPLLGFGKPLRGLSSENPSEFVQSQSKPKIKSFTLSIYYKT